MRYLVLAAFSLVISHAPANAEFIGQLELTPAGCQQTGSCKLRYDFGYRDPRGVGWQAKAGLDTDGASIPTWAQPFIGGAWEQQFIRAAVIHDHYCIRTVRARTQTHRMFHDALLESGVPAVKARIMFYAVMVGSHMWIDLMEGQPCQGVDNCIQNVGDRPTLPGAVIRSNDAGQLQAYRAPRFADPAVAADIAQAASLIEGGAAATPEDVIALAQSRHSGDIFISSVESIRYEGPSSRYPDR